MVLIVFGTYGTSPETLEETTSRLDKVRGAMFNMIGPYWKSADLRGAVIYVVSRHTSEAVLVERDVERRRL